MKNNRLILLLITLSIFGSYDGYSQESKLYSTIDTENVLSYKVEEIINMGFGGTTTRYTVSNLQLISQVNLGPGNIRIITPVYKGFKTRKKYYIEALSLDKNIAQGQVLNTISEITIDNDQIEISDNPKIDPNAIALAINTLTKKSPPAFRNNTVQKKQTPLKLADVSGEKSKIKVLQSTKIEENKSTNIESLTTRPIEKVAKNEQIKTAAFNSKEIVPATVVPVKAGDTTIAKKQLPKIGRSFIVINVIDVYERVAEKGYKSVFMFEKIANSYFFKDEMEKAVTYYEKLFAMTKELDPIYYFRFGDALKKTGDTKRGDEMIEKWHQLEKHSASEDTTKVN